MSSPLALLDKARDQEPVSASAHEESMSDAPQHPMPLRVDRADKERNITIAGVRHGAKDALAVLQTAAAELCAGMRPEELSLIVKFLKESSETFASEQAFVEAVAAHRAQFLELRAEAATPQEWAVLHRLRGKEVKRGFEDFVRATTPQADLKERVTAWEDKDGKYDPPKFSTKANKSHNWEGNALWVQAILGRKVLLTDVPLRNSNVLRKMNDDYTPVGDSDIERMDNAKKYLGEPSAYAREVAELLLQGYVGMWSQEIRPMMTQLGQIGEGEDTLPTVNTFLLVPDPSRHQKAIPPSLYALLSRKRYLDEKRLRAVVEGYKVSKELLPEVMHAFDLAGIPVAEPADRDERGLEVKQRPVQDRMQAEQRQVAIAKNAQALQDKDQVKQQKEDARREQAAASSEILVDGDEAMQLQSWLLDELRKRGCDYKRYTAKGPEMKELLAEGKDLGYFGQQFSVNSLKDYIVTHIRPLLPKQ